MNDLVITNIGKTLLADLVAGSDTATFCFIRTTDKDYSSVELETLTSLEEIKQETDITGVTKTDDYTVKVDILMDNKNLTKGYYIKTLGLYTQDSKGNTILFGVSISEEYHDYIPAFSLTTSSVDYSFYVKVDNAEQVIITVDPSAYATASQLAYVQEKLNEHTEYNVYSSDGVHGFRYYDDMLCYYDTAKKSWIEIKLTDEDAIRELIETNKIIVNNTLTSTSTTEALSALQGKNLKDTLDYCSAWFVGSRSITNENNETYTGGTNSSVAGWGCKATGSNSIAVGHLCNATATSSTAIGTSCTASANYASALGRSCTASSNSCALGYGSTASGASSSALGRSCIASGTGATSVGYGSTASNSYDLAIGRSCTASGSYSTAVGNANTATSTSSTAVGHSNTADNIQSLAVGYSNVADGEYSMAIGNENKSNNKYSSAIGHKNISSSDYAQSFGYMCTASGTASSSFGVNNTALSTYSNAFGSYNTASSAYDTAVGHYNTSSSGSSISAGYSNSATGVCATAIGNGNESINSYGSAVGYKNTASGTSSTTLGNQNAASANMATAIGSLNKSTSTQTATFGDNNTASSSGATAVGSGNAASGTKSSSFGNTNTSSGESSLAVGNENTVSANNSIAIGISNDVTIKDATAIGKLNTNTASCTLTAGYSCSAEGIYSTALGIFSKCLGGVSIAAGYANTAEGDTSVALGGWNTLTKNSTTVIGICNESNSERGNIFGNENTNNTYGCTVVGGFNNGTNGSATVQSTTSDRFVVGIGSSVSGLKNGLRIIGTGAVYGGTYNSSGADYAEYFEWLDGNPANEDRIGKFVTVKQGKIQLAQAEDTFILGVVSGNGSVIGDAQEDEWIGLYERDIYGRLISEDFEEEVEEEYFNDDGEKLTRKVIRKGDRLKKNKNVRTDEPYIPRSKRAEWGVVGLLGKLIVDDDGTCEVDGFCSVGSDGVATDGDKFLVLERLDDTHIKILKM